MDSLPYLLDDYPRTLFPLSSTIVLSQHCLAAMLAFLSNLVLDPSQRAQAFLPRTRVFASKHGLNLRPPGSLSRHMVGTPKDPSLGLSKSRTEDVANSSIPDCFFPYLCQAPRHRFI